MKPYSEEKSGNVIRRTFSNIVENSELVWHRDKEDRIVLVLQENDWMLQFDNQLPKKLNTNEEYFIPKNVYHRVIKGSNDLVVEIIETTFEDDVNENLEEAKKKDACYYKVKSRYDVWPSAYACVPENTSKALTRNGWRHVNELSVGDEIMTYNIEKDELEFKPILNLHRYKDVKTNVVRSGNNGFIFEATDNHKWVVKLPEIKGTRLEKYNRINDKALIETSDLLINKKNKHLVVSAQYNGGENVKLDKIFKYGSNWVKYILDITSEQRQAWLFSAIVYDGNQQKIERLTENTDNIEELDWLYTGTQKKQSFGFKQKDIEHRDAFLLSAFLNSGLVTWKKVKDKDIYSCHYTSNKRFKNTSNFKIVKENISDVWCPETENGTWVMMQETDGNGIITITGNSGALVKCRKVGAANWGTKSEGEEPIEEKWSEKYKRSIDCNNPKGFSQRAHCQGRKKANEEIETYSLDELIVYENKDINNSNQELINLAHDSITRTKGKDYSPDVHELQAWIDNYLKESDNKTDFSKEKEQGLHGWFARQGGEGKSKGWVDCNTCRKDPETGRKKCKSCGRKSGEERSKYPSCRPTPSACKTSGKGEKWGKTKENLQVSENISTFDKDFIKKTLKESFNQEDNMTKPMIEPQVKPEPKVVPAPDTVQPNISPSRRNKPFLPMPGIETDPKAITK